MSSKPFPHADGMVSFWRADPHALDNHRSTPELPSEVDILIIGGGYAGVSTAHHIYDQTKSNPQPPSVLILEARQACSGATGRNGGHLKPDSYNAVATLAEEYGYEAAGEVAAFEADHVDALQALIEEEKIDCDFTITRALDVQFSDEHCQRLKSGYDKLRDAGVAATKKTFYVSQQAAEGFSGVKGAKSCFGYTAGHLWPYKLVTALLARTLSSGANLQTHTPVNRVSDSRDKSGRYTVETPRGTVRAKWVVFATNAYTAALLPEYKNRIVPVRGTCSQIIAPEPAPLLSFSYTLRWGPSAYDYLIPRSDGSTIVGGARPSALSDADPWYNNVDDSQLVGSAKSYFDGYMQRNFRGWENSGAKTDRVWTGIMGYSSDLLPHVGQVPSKPGQMILGGFTGHGMPVVFLTAKGIAKMIVSGAPFAETGVPRIFETSQARLDSKINKILATVEGDTEPQAKL